MCIQCVCIQTYMYMYVYVGIHERQRMCSTDHLCEAKIVNYVLVCGRSKTKRFTRDARHLAFVHVYGRVCGCGHVQCLCACAAVALRVCVYSACALVCVFVYAHACMHVHVHMFVHACVREIECVITHARACVRACVCCVGVNKCLNPFHVKSSTKQNKYTTDIG